VNLTNTVKQNSTFATLYTHIMNLSGVKLVVTDMDGTLLNSNHEVSDLFFKQFEALKENNIHFVAASGRQYHSILDKLQAIEEDITIVAENGAYIVRNGETLFINEIPKVEIHKLLPICQAIKGIQVVVCGKKKAYLLKDTSTQFKNTIAEYYSSYTILESFDQLPDDKFFKIALCHYEGSEENIYPYVKEFEDNWQVKVSGKLWIDISQKSAHKGNAISKLQQQFKISPEQTIAFGDYNNDAEMLKLANYSFAMANAHPNIKAIANYATASNDKNGVELILDKLITSL